MSDLTGATVSIDTEHIFSVMLNSLLATLDASQRLWDRARSGTEEGVHGAIISIPLSAVQSPAVIELERGNPGVSLQTDQKNVTAPRNTAIAYATNANIILKDIEDVADKDSYNGSHHVSK